MKNEDYYCHPAAINETDSIGSGTRIWAFVHILPEVVIGEDCNICDHCFIENNVRIGNRVTIKSFNYLCSGVVLEDDVFIASGVSFTNDRTPRSRQYIEPLTTIVRKGASIGAGSSLISDIEIGRYAMIGHGSVVTRPVKAHALVYGNPAVQHGWVDETGEKLRELGSSEWISSIGNVYTETEKGLIRKK